MSWSHHREVADLDAGQQAEWLARARDEGLAANELRLAIKGGEPEVRMYECPNCQHEGPLADFRREKP